MMLKENIEIKEICERLKRGMIEYMELGEVSYSEIDVEKCMTLLSNFLNKIENSTSKEEGVEIIEKTVLSLNDLNEDCDDELIETEQRDAIVEIIIIAGNKKRYNATDEDLTEEWREW